MTLLTAHKAAVESEAKNPLETRKAPATAPFIKRREVMPPAYEYESRVGFSPPSYQAMSEKEVVALTCEHNWAVAFPGDDLTLQLNTARIFCTECHIQRVLSINSVDYQNHQPNETKMRQNWCNYWNAKQALKYDEQETAHHEKSFQAAERLRLEQELQQTKEELQEAKTAQLQQDGLEQLRKQIEDKLAILEERAAFLEEMEKPLTNSTEDSLAHPNSDVLITSENTGKKSLQLRSLGSKIWGTATGMAKEVVIRSLTRLITGLDS